jgi:hypothetical protein
MRILKVLRLLLDVYGALFLIVGASRWLEAPVSWGSIAISQAPARSITVKVRHAKAKRWRKIRFCLSF